VGQTVEYKKESTIICLGDPKQAALYYDRVVPVSFAFSRSEQSPEKYVYDLANLLGLNLPHDKETFMTISKKLGDFIPITTYIMSAHSHCSKINIIGNTLGITHSNKIREYFITKGFGRPASESILTEDEFPDILLMALGLSYIEDIKLSKKNTSIRSIINEFSYFFGISHASILLPNECINCYPATEDDLSFSIANFPLVDTKNAHWDQILEFRKDKASRKKFRNLLLFFHENYEGKNYEFVEDDLGKRLDEYYITSKDWGFEIRNSIFSALMDSQNLLATTAAILGAILLNEPIAQNVSALAGVTLNIGKILLTYDKQKHAFHKLKRDHDLAYIIEAKENLENAS
jgi:hypothetical protein